MEKNPHEPTTGRPAPPPLITLGDVAFRYPGPDAFELRVPTFTVTAGETVALTGKSGCGKTTLANLISGLLVPQRGTVEVAGAMVSALGDTARRNFRIANVGYLFQDFGLLDYLSTEENILLPFAINRTLRLDDEARDRARKLARGLGIAHRLGAKPRALSGGERQRAALARAMVAEPKLIIADEPTGNLDPETAARTLDLILATARSAGATLLSITHAPEMAARHGRTVDLRDLSAPSP